MYYHVTTFEYQFPCYFSHPASYAAAAAGSAASGTSSSSAAAHSNMPAGSSDSNKKRRTDTDAQQTALMAQLRELTSNTEATANKVSSMQQWFKKEHIQKPFKLFCKKFKRLLQEQHKANHAVKELTNDKTRGSIPKSMKIERCFSSSSSGLLSSGKQ